MLSLVVARKSWLLGCILASALIVLGYAAGCSRKSPAPTPPPQMDIDVASDHQTNDGQPFYLVIRAVTDKQFLTDNYQGIAGMVYSDPPDPTVLLAAPILPGKERQFKVVKPTQGAIGLYFLFSQQTDQWKMLLSQPLSDAGYNISIVRNVIFVEPKRSLWRRIF
jgi:predicted component of type VI protein secretion system